MAIYRGEGGATDVEPAPGNTEFAGGIIVEEDILSKGKITAEEGFYGDGSALTNLPNDNVWKDNGSSIEFTGNGATTTQVWAKNNGKYAKVIQQNDGQAYFKGDGATSLGTDSDLPVNIFVSGTNQLAVGNDSIYAFQDVTAPFFIGDGSKLTNLPSTGITDVPDDGILYGRRDSTWQRLPVGDNVYTKAQIDAQQEAQDTKITVNNDEIARQQIEITNNTSEIDKNDSAINKNILDISSNTTAIGTLSGQVSQNSEDIAELQDSIFFSSAYSADYPSNPNRDPEEGNMYLQNFAMFTYSYAAATQIFASKTDESGNVRQFTAIQPGDSIVLNEVDSPNYGRYELVTVEDVSDSYVVMNVIPKKGQGTVITGVKVAFQAFPKPDSGGGTGEGTVADGCIYLNNQTITADYTIPAGKNGMSSGPIKFDGTLTVPTGSAYHVVDSDEDSLWTEVDGVATYGGDIKVNGVTVGTGGGSGDLNTALGAKALRINKSGKQNTALGWSALESMDTGTGNTGTGINAGNNVTTGDSNTLLGNGSGYYLTTGSNNTCIGNQTYTSAPDVSNEVTIGNDDVTKTRLRGKVDFLTKDESAGTAVSMVLKGITTGNNNVQVQFFPRSSQLINPIGIIQGRLTIGTSGAEKGNLEFFTANNGDLKKRMVIDGEGNTIINGAINAPTLQTATSSTTPLGITAEGWIYKTSATYSTQEVDEKLATKDKIIEALEARLTKLEARNK